MHLCKLCCALAFNRILTNKVATRKKPEEDEKILGIRALQKASSASLLWPLLEKCEKIALTSDY